MNCSGSGINDNRPHHQRQPAPSVQLSAVVRGQRSRHRGEVDRLRSDRARRVCTENASVGSGGGGRMSPANLLLFGAMCAKHFDIIQTGTLTIQFVKPSFAITVIDPRYRKAGTDTVTLEKFVSINGETIRAGYSCVFNVLVVSLPDAPGE